MCERERGRERERERMSADVRQCHPEAKFELFNSYSFNLRAVRTLFRVLMARTVGFLISEYADAEIFFISSVVNYSQGAVNGSHCSFRWQ